MPTRSTPPPAPPKGAFYPPNDAATHRDLLYFEERLKTMADSLQRRKFRYELFLVQLVIVIVILLAEVRLHTSFLAIPYRYVLRTHLPNMYGPDTDVALHPYIATGLLFVSVTTLVLFFASGMYAEKIAYANRYVPHANKALRSLNMYLNVRQPPLRSKVPFNPFAFFFPRPSSPSPVTKSTPPPTSSPPPPTHTTAITNMNAPGPIPVPIPPIPPSTNPRGELIFSSRVDKSFRDSYARHRAAFERRRDELERLARARTWFGRLLLCLQPWSARTHTSLGQPSSTGTPNASGAGTPGGVSRTISASSRGRTGSAVPTPVGSRRSSPVPRKDSPDGISAIAGRRRAYNLDVP